MPLLVALAGLIACAAGLFVDARSTFAAWLAAEIFWLALPLGALALVLIAEVTGRAWLDPFRPAAAAAMATLPALAIGFLPVLAGIGALYPWAAGDRADSAAFWLNLPSFVVRAVVYFAIWLSLAVAALRRGPALGEGAAAGGLVLLGFTVNFAAIDWTMSLDPHFASSVYGYTAMAGLLLDGIALLLLVSRTVRAAPAPLAGIALALVITWAYLAFMQYLIVWESDLAREIPWYLRREQGVWGGIGLAVLLTHFLLPLLMLLPGRVRRGGMLLGAACGLLVAGRLLDCWWLVFPDVAGAALSWQAAAAIVTLGGLVAAASRLPLRATSLRQPSAGREHG
jgi:hypothetical protein